MIEIDGLVSGVFASNMNICQKKLPNNATEDAKTEHGKKRDAALAELLKLAANSYSGRYHFLPPCQSFAGGLLNFQKVQSIPVREFSEKFTKHGTITTEFLKDIVSRFAAYYARQGQPNFEINKMVERLIGESSN